MPKASRTFTATVQSSKGRWHIELPFDPDEAWGTKERHHVAGTVNATGIRGPLAVESGHWVLILPPAWRRDSPLEPGQPVAVELCAEGPQLEDLPVDIGKALEGSPRANEFFQSLPTFYRKTYLTWLSGSARRPAVRAERLEQFIELLEAGKKERPR
ncbi:MAG: YdeI/OmpD-associated family protein [Dehalococcoidia bacterium]